MLKLIVLEMEKASSTNIHAQSLDAVTHQLWVIADAFPGSVRQLSLPLHPAT